MPNDLASLSLRPSLSTDPVGEDLDPSLVALASAIAHYSSPPQSGVSIRASIAPTLNALRRSLTPPAFHAVPAASASAPAPRRPSLTPRVPSIRPVLTLPPAVRAKRMFRIVRQLASQMARRLPPHVELDELVAAGGVGLADALSRRNGMPSSEFEAFACFRIRGAMLDELRRLDHMPRRARASARAVAKARRAVEQRSGAAADDEQIAKELGVTLAEYQSLQGRLDLRRRPVQLRTVLEDDEEREADVQDPAAEMPETAVARREIGELVLEGVNALPPRMQQVLRGLYVEGRTMKEVGAELGVSESRVCQIHGEAMAIIRAQITASPASRTPANDADADAAPVSGCRARAGSVSVVQDRRPTRRSAGA